MTPRHEENKTATKSPLENDWFIFSPVVLAILQDGVIGKQRLGKTDEETVSQIQPPYLRQFLGFRHNLQKIAKYKVTMNECTTHSLTATLFIYFVTSTAMADIPASEVVWATDGGTRSASEQVQAMDTADNGSVFIGGVCRGETAEFGSFTLTDSPDSYVAKLTENGEYEWATPLKNDSVLIRDIATDANGDVYVVGGVKGNMLKIGQSEFQIASASPQTATFDRGFIAKIDGMTGEAVWFRRSEGNRETGLSVIADSTRGVVYVAFASSATTFNFHDNIRLPRVGTGRDLVVLKLSLSTGDAEWGERTTSNSTLQEFTAIYNSIQMAVDSEGNVHLAGQFNGRSELGNFVLPQFPPRPSTASQQIFLAKLSAEGEWQSAKQFGTPFTDSATSIALDDSDNIYIGGGGGTGDVDFGDGVTIRIDGGFVAKFSPDGTAQWAHPTNGRQTLPLEVATDRVGNLFVIGLFRESVSLGGFTARDPGLNSETFVAKLSSQGVVRWLSSFGGDGNSASGSWKIDLHRSGNIVIAGSTSDPITIGDAHFEEVDTFSSYTLTLMLKDPDGQVLPSDGFRISDISLTALEIRLSWNSLPGKLVAVEQSSDLSEWEPVPGFESIDQTTATISRQTFSVPYYRVRVIAP